jgi:thiaminase
MSSTSTLSSRACLSRLPTEVKANIAEHCSKQDEFYKVWREVYQLYDKSDHIETLLQRLDTFHGRSIRNLYQVSKEWADIAAPFNFKVSAEILALYLPGIRIDK